MERVGGVDRAKTIRKIKQVVIFRDIYLKSEGKKIVFRSRINTDAYSGINNLFAIVEGNPRLIIGMLYPLIKDMHEKSEAKIYKGKQTRQIKSVLHTLRALLQTISVPRYDNANDSKGLLELIDIIGNSFKAELYRESFNPDLPLCFTVDKDISQELHDTIGQALNVGAIIHKTKIEDAEVISNLSGKTFRLSYLLATAYYLPVFMPGKSKSLVNILQESGVKINPNQYQLPL
ncbi:MAG: hypothetical protein HGB12_16845 [Bacteroidetes bacterium]|nr:hypothetical protein [Bacteroidota bacterium]